MVASKRAVLETYSSVLYSTCYNFLVCMLTVCLASFVVCYSNADIIRVSGCLATIACPVFNQIKIVIMLVKKKYKNKQLRK